MRRPRLVYVVTHPVTADVLLKGQLAFMRERGFDVTVVAAPGPLLDRVADREKIRTLAVPMARATDPKRDLVSLFRMQRALVSLAPDIVNAGTTKAGLLGLLAARAARVPVRIYLLRGLRLENIHGPARRVLAVTEKVAAACAHDVVCVSPSLRELAVSGGWIPAAKATVLGAGSSNGVNTDTFRRTPELRARGAQKLAEFGVRESDKVIGFVGRLVAEKGIYELLDAFQRVLAAVPEAKLVLLGGDFGDEKLDKDLLARVRSARGVVATGRIEDLTPYYARMDVLGFPSYREGFPNVPLEAASSEVPTVGFRSTGVVDAVVDGATGYLSAKRDVDGLAHALVRYLQDDALRAAHGEAARARVLRSFRRELVWQAWAEAYETRLARVGISSSS